MIATTTNNIRTAVDITTHKEEEKRYDKDMISASLSSFVYSER